jgi:hypothetical protein
MPASPSALRSSPTWLWPRRIQGLLLHRVAEPPRPLGSDELGIRAGEGLIGDVARSGVELNGPDEQLDPAAKR